MPGYTEAQILAGQSSLKHIVGDLNITTPGAVISNEWIDGCIGIFANNVTIQNSLIRTQDVCHGGDYGTAPSAINNGNGDSPTGLVIKNTEVDGMNGSGDTYGVTAVNYTCYRCNVHGFAKDLQESNNVLIQDTYAHDLTIHDHCAHANVVYDESATNSAVQHSYLDATGTSTDCISGAFNFEGAYGSPDHLTLNNSYLAGHAGADISGDCGATTVHITNNALSSDNGYNHTDYVVSFNRYNAGNVWKSNYVPELSNRPAPPPSGDPGSTTC